MFKVTHLISCRAQNIPITFHLNFPLGKTKCLTMASKTVLVKVLAEVDDTDKVLTEDSIIKGPKVLSRVKETMVEVKHPGNNNNEKPLLLLDLKGKWE